MAANLDPIKIQLRPAPDMPSFPPGTPPQVRQDAENVRRWCRDAEKAIRALVEAVNVLQKLV